MLLRFPFLRRRPQQFVFTPYDRMRLDRELEALLRNAASTDPDAS